MSNLNEEKLVKSELSKRLDIAFDIAKNQIDPDGELKTGVVYKMLNLSQSTFSAYRRGSQPAASVLEKLSSASGINIHWLVTGEGPKLISDTVLGSRVKHIWDDSWLSIDSKFLSVKTSYRYDYVIDNSMIKTVNAGDLVVIDTDLKDGEGLYLIEYNDVRLIRRIQAKSNTEYTIFSDSDDVVAVPKDRVKFIGQVVYRAGAI